VVSITVVVLTRNRRPELLRTLDRMVPLGAPVIVADNASADGTADAVRDRYPGVRLLALSRNLGAVARNIAVEQVRTPYVAFCDDDCWWQPGALDCAVHMLDAYPSVAAVTGRILVEPTGRADPLVAEPRSAPVAAPVPLPGPAVVSILAGASALRVAAFRAVGGFSPRLWLGGEEELLSADLASAGWQLCYVEDILVQHRPPPMPDARPRRHDGSRDPLRFTWLRRPVRRALLRTVTTARQVPRDRVPVPAFLAALAGLPWVLRQRRRVPADLEAAIGGVERDQSSSGAHRYVD
jgi:N-acetylglucosaminyl-diphospho-decaprenol L-rhamnosyltransferase